MSDVEIEGRRLRLSNLDKVLYPDAGFTKAQVVDYYARIGAVMVPHLADRPVTLVRWPDGVASQSFFEKRCPSHAPDWMRSAAVSDDLTQCVLDDLPSLVWAANMAALELHTPQARVSSPDRPDSMVFDLDPGPGATVLDCCRVGLDLQGVLAELGLECVVKTSGSKGLHLAVPLHTSVTDEDTKGFALALGQLLAKREPDRVTVIMRKDERKGKVFVDWSQNDRHKTTVCAYSMRGRARPIVSAPVSWDEVSDALDAGDPDTDLLTFEAADALDPGEPRAPTGAARAATTASVERVNLDGKVAIVTGASRGVGAATAIALAEAGAAVACAARATDANPLRLPGTIDGTVRRITDAGGQALAVPTNLAREEDVERMVAATAEHFGRLDILVNNAAITFPDDIDVPMKRYDLMLAVNLRAPLVAAQAAVPHMKQLGEGAILNVSSAAALSYIPGLMVYGMSKIALEHLTVSLATQLLPARIAVNTFRIDVPVASEGFVANLPDVDHSDWEPTEVPAEGIVWMLRQPPSYTGHNVGMARLREEEGIMASRVRSGGGTG